MNAVLRSRWSALLVVVFSSASTARGGGPLIESKLSWSPQLGSGQVVCDDLGARIAGRFAVEVKLSGYPGLSVGSPQFSETAGHPNQSFDLDVQGENYARCLHTGGPNEYVGVIQFDTYQGHDGRFDVSSLIYWTENGQPQQRPVQLGSYIAANLRVLVNDVPQVLIASSEHPEREKLYVTVTLRGAEGGTSSVSLSVLSPDAENLSRLPWPLRAMRLSIDKPVQGDGTATFLWDKTNAFGDTVGDGVYPYGASLGVDGYDIPGWEMSVNPDFFAADTSAALDNLGDEGEPFQFAFQYSLNHHSSQQTIRDGTIYWYHEGELHDTFDIGGLLCTYHNDSDGLRTGTLSQWLQHRLIATFSGADRELLEKGANDFVIVERQDGSTSEAGHRDLPLTVRAPRGWVPTQDPFLLKPVECEDLCSDEEPFDIYEEIEGTSGFEDPPPFPVGAAGPARADIRNFETRESKSRTLGRFSLKRNRGGPIKVRLLDPAFGYPDFDIAQEWGGRNFFIAFDDGTRVEVQVFQGTDSNPGAILQSTKGNKAFLHPFVAIAQSNIPTDTLAWVLIVKDASIRFNGRTFKPEKLPLFDALFDDGPGVKEGNLGGAWRGAERDLASALYIDFPGRAAIYAGQSPGMKGLEGKFTAGDVVTEEVQFVTGIGLLHRGARGPSLVGVLYWG
jgi:hypothetical protein